MYYCLEGLLLLLLSSKQNKNARYNERFQVAPVAKHKIKTRAMEKSIKINTTTKRNNKRDRERESSLYYI